MNLYHGVGILFLCLVGTIEPAFAENRKSADSLRSVDQMTQQWLDTERQSTQLQNDWRAQEPILTQRRLLLEQEKKQLLAILQDNDNSQSDVDEQRKQLLAEQDALEQQQTELEKALKVLLSRTQSLQAQLPPPLQRAWQEEQNALNVGALNEPDLSQQLHVVLAQLSQVADFDQRISLHDSPLKKADGSEILVKQLYLGLGIAWFVSADNQYAGWGQADEDGWHWTFDQNINAAEISHAIAMFEKREQANFVSLPFYFAGGAIQP